MMTIKEEILDKSGLLEEEGVEQQETDEGNKKIERFIKVAENQELATFSEKIMFKLLTSFLSKLSKSDNRFNSIVYDAVRKQFPNASLKNCANLAIILTGNKDKYNVD